MPKFPISSRAAATICGKLEPGTSSLFASPCFSSPIFSSGAGECRARPRLRPPPPSPSTGHHHSTTSPFTSLLFSTGDPSRATATHLRHHLTATSPLFFSSGRPSLSTAPPYSAASPTEPPSPSTALTSAPSSFLLLSTGECRPSYPQFGRPLYSPPFFTPFLPLFSFLHHHSLPVRPHCSSPSFPSPANHLLISISRSTSAPPLLLHFSPPLLIAFSICVAKLPLLRPPCLHYPLRPSHLLQRASLLRLPSPPQSPPLPVLGSTSTPFGSSPLYATAPFTGRHLHQRRHPDFFLFTAGVSTDISADSLTLYSASSTLLYSSVKFHFFTIPLSVLNYSSCTYC